ncbi:MAG: hypothetical protein ACERKN_13000 [Velocimicrobium sp.]
MNSNNVSATGASSYLSSTSYPSTSSVKKEREAATSNTNSSDEKNAVVYESSKKNEPSNSTSKSYKKDTETITNLLNDLNQRKQQLKDLVEKTLLKQGQTLDISESILDVLKSGNLKFSIEDITQAKEDVSEDGYWGVNQTSERLYSFAYALAGGDPSKADTLMNAIEKGYDQATKSFGGELPDISKQTLEATREKINAWKNGTTETK